MLSATQLMQQSPQPAHGLNGILAAFGDLFAYILPDRTLDPRWADEHLATIPLAFPIALSWDPSRRVTRITCNKHLESVFSDCFQLIENSGLQQEITSFGGCFCFRPQRLGTKLSTHAWGIAIDLNPESNAQGTAGNMHPGIVSIFRNAGFTWGGDWDGKSRDPMHFQFCTGY